MYIAQRSVAGEGELYPTHSADLEAPNDAAALTAYRCDSTNLPWTIFRAAFRANQIEEISQRGRSVLAALARTVDAAKPFAAIFARRELLSGRAMQSMRTFYRSLDDLETAGLIDRRPQTRYVEAGLFGRAYLHLTDRAALLLGLVEAPAPQKATRPAEPAQPLSPSFQQPSANVADGAIYKDLSPSTFQKRQPGKVPADLQRLRTLGFFDFLIFKLMREAREHGKRLSDVVEATWNHLKLAKAPINYLRALLQGSVDFAHQLRSQMQAKAEMQARLQRTIDAARVARQSAGQTFVDVSGQRTFVIDATGETMTVYNRTENVGRQAAGWKEGFAAAHARGQIRPASHEDMTSFLQIRARTSQTTRDEDTSRTPVTAQVRDHIAGLWSLLGSRGHVIRTTD